MSQLGEIGDRFGRGVRRHRGLSSVDWRNNDNVWLVNFLTQGLDPLSDQRTQPLRPSGRRILRHGVQIDSVSRIGLKVRWSSFARDSDRIVIVVNTTRINDGIEVAARSEGGVQCT